MDINEKIFKAYDIRGIYPEEINDQTAYKVGRAFAVYSKPKKVIIGRDVRHSSKNLSNSFIKGLIDEGVYVEDVGLVPTPVLSYLTAHLNFDGGVIVTASHNPQKYNGLKFYGKGAFPIGKKTGLDEIKKLAIKNEFESKNKGKVVLKPEHLDFFNQHLDDLLKNKNFENFKIVADAGNAMASVVFKNLFKKMKCQITPLFWKFDGSFPNRSPDFFESGALDSLKEQVLKTKSDLGIATDGDADRIIFIDEKGEEVRGDLITALITKRFLKQNPSEKVVYTVSSSRIIEEIAKEYKGEAIMSEVGHTLVQQKMIEHKAIFAGEISGHYFLRDNYNTDSSFDIIVYLLDIMSKEKKKLSELINPLLKYHFISKNSIEIGDLNKDKILKDLENKYRDGKISHLDGLRVDYPDWWFVIRPSNTQPVLRLRVEAETKKLAQEKFNEITGMIEN